MLHPVELRGRASPEERPPVPCAEKTAGKEAAELPTCRPNRCCSAWACRKLLRRPQDGLCPTPVSHFVNLWKAEAERKQPVLLAHGPRAGKAEALAQPQHGLEALDRAPGRVEGLEAADPRHGPLHPEVVALDPLL